MTRFRIPLALALLAVAALAWVNPPTSARAVVGPIDEAVVRLYDDEGDVIREWKAISAGRMEGDTFVFQVRKGVEDLEVRIRGTFTYEEQP